MSQLQILDATGARVIADIVTALERRGITVLIKGIQERHLKLAPRVGVLESLRHHKHLFAELDRPSNTPAVTSRVPGPPVPRNIPHLTRRPRPARTPSLTGLRELLPEVPRSDE